MFLLPTHPPTRGRGRWGSLWAADGGGDSGGGGAGGIGDEVMVVIELLPCQQLALLGRDDSGAG